MQIDSWILTTFIPILSLIIALWSLATIRPNLRADLDFAKQKPGNAPYSDLYTIGITVINNGVLPIKYKIRSRSEVLHRQGMIEKSSLILASPNTVSESGSEGNDPGATPITPGFYTEIVHSRGVYPSKTWKKWNLRNVDRDSVIAYDVQHKLKFGEATLSGSHIIGQVSLNLDALNYTQAINEVLWESYVEIVPVGFWGLPILRVFNQRKLKFSNVYLMVRAVDRSV